MKHAPASVDGGIVLTADLVRVQRRQGRLHIIKLEGVKAKRAETLAAALLEVLSRNRGNAREILLGQWKAIDHKASEKRLLLGLQDSYWMAASSRRSGAEPAQIRAEVFRAPTTTANSRRVFGLIVGRFLRRSAANLDWMLRRWNVVSTQICGALNG